MSRPKERRILAGLAVAFAVLIFVELLLLGSAKELRKAAEWVGHTRDTLERINQLVTYLSDAENARRGYVLSGQDLYMGQHTNRVGRAEAALQELRELMKDNPRQSAACDELEGLIRRRLTIFTTSIQARQADGLDVPSQTKFMEQGQEVMTSIRQLVAQMTAAEDARLKERLSLQEKNTKGTEGFAVLVSLFGLGLFAALVLLFSRANRHRRRAEAQLQEANLELEQRVQERTAELLHTVEKLEQAAKRAAELRTAKERAESADRHKTTFLASMSHELRTPLNAIIGFTGTLLMKLPGPLTAEQEKQLRTVQNSGKHLLSLINDLLDLARIEEGRVELNLEPVTCQNVVQEVATALQPAANRKGLSLEVHVPREAIVLRTDRRALSQILINLTHNAIKFTEQGSIQLELCQRRDNGRSLAEINVIDTGIGINPKDQAILFQAFAQVVGEGQRHTEGTGLGLHLSRKLSELLGGRLTLESKPGEGCRFTLALGDTCHSPPVTSHSYACADSDH